MHSQAQLLKKAMNSLLKPALLPLLQSNTSYNEPKTYFALL